MQPSYFISLACGLYGQIRVAEERGDRIGSVRTPVAYGTKAAAFAFAPMACVTRHQLALGQQDEAEAEQAARDTLKGTPGWPSVGVHLVLGPRQKLSLRRDVYVIRAIQMQTWLDQLTQAGLGHAQIIPEVCLLNEDEINRIGDEVEDTGPPLPDDEPHGEGPEGGEPPRILSDIDAETHLIRLAERLRNRKVVDLRTGPFAPPRPDKASFARWRVIAGAGIGAASIWTGTLFFETRNYEHATRQAEAQSEEIYTRIFGAAQVSASDGAGGQVSLAQGPFITLGSRLDEVVSAIDGSRIERLRYEGATLTARLSIPGDLAVSTLAGQLSSAMFTARIEAVLPGEAGYQVDLVMEATR